MRQPAPLWDWESHVMPEEAAELSALWREADEIRIRLETIEIRTTNIQKRAMGRAKFAHKLRQQS